MKKIYDCTREQLEKYFASINEKKYRATQVFEWLYKKRVKSFVDMNNLNNSVIDKLNDDFIINNIKVIKKQTDEGVIKYLFELYDENKIESVLMFHDYGNSLCLSTQIGCNMGCLFCESGQLKKIRDLAVNEMVLQLLAVEEDTNKRISHIVLMGIGEPLDNYENVINFIKIINDNKGIDIGARHITISTCGLIKGINKIMNEGIQINLAISLHAPNDELRTKLMPVNKAHNINKLMPVIREYIEKTKRRVTFEYIMLDNINDSEEVAIELCHLLRGINCYVNLIPYNKTSNSDFNKSEKMKIKKFYDILKKHKINVTIRKEFGQGVSAACGQLRANCIRR
jgi:23S rRNA (adenine2503-C2)-methyltransferase